MFCRFFTLSAPVDDISRLYILTAIFTVVYSHISVYERGPAFWAEHIRLSNKISTVFRWCMIIHVLTFLELVQMLSVLLEALITEGEVITLFTIESVLAIWDGIHAPVTGVPGFVSWCFFLLFYLCLETLGNSLLVELFLLLPSLFNILFWIANLINVVIIIIVNYLSNFLDIVGQ